MLPRPSDKAVVRYGPIEPWGSIPPDIEIEDVVAIAAGPHDRIFVLARGSHPVIIMDRQGNFVDSWGQGLFMRPHGLELTSAELLLITDDGASCVYSFDLDGRAIGTIGVPKKPSPFMSGEPFHRCTHTAMSPDGNVYISDGYGNACVHKFTAKGQHLLTWGEPGTGPGQFYIPHNICCDEDGRVYVADRENHRIQVFDANGVYQTEWRGVHRPCALCSTGTEGDRLFFVGEVGPAMRATLGFPNLGPRLSVLDADGNVKLRIGDPLAGPEQAPLVAPHGLTVDRHGDIYIADLVTPSWPALFPDVPIPAGRSRLRKVKRLD
jgi:DNA-binding beta-propeller fold protein YncE